VSAQTTNAAGTEVTSERFGYVYDASQNLRWRTNNTTVTGFTNNTLNQLASLNSTTRTHDRRGNLISSVQPAETLLYTWDDESQLTSVLLDPPSSPAFQPWRIDFVYDGLRRLRRTIQYTWNGSAWTSQGESRHLYDGMLIVQERSSGNTPQVHYSRGLDLSGTIHGAGGIGGLLMRSHGYSGGNWSSHNAYHSDANGNVTALVNSSGVLQASYKYNPYGGLISFSGALASANRMRFSSKLAVFSSGGSWGFYYYGHRFYDPVSQRWLNRDPIEEAGGNNVFQAMGSDPIGKIDPLGLLGLNLLPDEDPLHGLAGRFVALPDSPSAEFYVTCHGSGLTLYSTPDSMISITALAHAIKSDPTWNPGRTVSLLACEAGRSLPYGRSPFARPMCPAEELAKTLGCPVRAPTKLLWWNPPIDRWSLPELRILGPLGPPKPGLPNPNDPGDWVTYYPDM